MPGGAKPGGLFDSAAVEFAWAETFAGGGRQCARRLYFDLVGLPPRPEEVAEFEGDKSPDAYNRLVEKLLTSRITASAWQFRGWM